MIDNALIYPVILPVPEKDTQKVAPKKVRALSRRARQALYLSAQHAGIVLGELKKDDSGVPLPFNGLYWSLSHKSKYVAAVVAPKRVGIDVEEIRPITPPLFDKIAGKTEWKLIGNRKLISFFRYWTSKEAALKAVGTGLKDLSKCRIKKVIDEDNLIIDYQDTRWQITHHFFNGHIASVVKNSFRVKWILL